MICLNLGQFQGKDVKTLKEETFGLSEEKDKPLGLLLLDRSSLCVSFSLEIVLTCLLLFSEIILLS